MNQYTKYWVWLQQSLGYASAKVRTVLRFYPTVKEFYDGGEKEWILCGCFSKTEFNRLSSNTLEQAQEVVDCCENLGYQILTLEEEAYPKRLKEIYNPPAVLYVKGCLPPIDRQLCIAMVGTRNATPEGIKTAFHLSAGLSKAGVTVVSGGALGIDSASHRGVLQSGGKTVCVLGCGINYNYLMTNAQLRKQIADNGAVISEYPPNTSPQKQFFPMRNRIISGLSQGTLVVEAGEKSGALITADFALEQNRDVFAVPGSITHAACFGTNYLIKQGAIPVTGYADVLAEYEGVDGTQSSSNVPPSIPNFPRQAKANMHSPNKQNTLQEKDVSSFSQEAQRVYQLIYSHPINIDDIIVKTGLPVSKVMQSLTELELTQIIERKSGRMYHPI